MSIQETQKWRANRRRTCTAFVGYAVCACLWACGEARSVQPGEGSNPSGSGGAASASVTSADGGGDTTVATSSGGTSGVSSGGGSATVVGSETAAGGTSTVGTATAISSDSSSTGEAIGEGCPEVIACDGEPYCAAVLATSVNDCKSGSFACGDVQGFLIEDAAGLHDFPCASPDGGVVDCSTAISEHSTYWSECVSGPDTTTTTGSSGSAGGSGGSGGGSTEPTQCGCGEPGTSNDWWVNGCSSSGCFKCPPGYINCDGYGGCEQPIVDSSRTVPGICNSVAEWRAGCCDGDSDSIRSDCASEQLPTWLPSWQADNPCNRSCAIVDGECSG